MASVPPRVCVNCGGPKSYEGTICRRCYEAARHDSRPLIEIVRDPKTIARFMKKVEPQPNGNGCRLWTASIIPSTGYGNFGINSMKYSAHVIAHMMFIGPVPDGHHVLHACDVRACVCPEHLFTGTQRVNMIDCASKGRINTQKLTADDVRSIRAIYAAGGISQEELGKRFGMGQSQIHRIVNRQTWTFVD